MIICNISTKGKLRDRLNLRVSPTSHGEESAIYINIPVTKEIYCFFVLWQARTTRPYLDQGDVPFRTTRQTLFWIQVQQPRFCIIIWVPNLFNLIFTNGPERSRLFEASSPQTTPLSCGPGSRLHQTLLGSCPTPNFGLFTSLFASLIGFDL